MQPFHHVQSRNSRQSSAIKWTTLKKLIFCNAHRKPTYGFLFHSQQYNKILFSMVEESFDTLTWSERIPDRGANFRMMEMPSKSSIFIVIQQSTRSSLFRTKPKIVEISFITIQGKQSSYWCPLIGLVRSFRKVIFGEKRRSLLLFGFFINFTFPS